MERNVIGTSRKPKNIKIHNQKLVVELLRKESVLSVSEIADKIKLSITTIIKILHFLQDRGLIISDGKGDSTAEGGKRPEIYSLNAEFAHAVSVYINGDIMHILLTNAKICVLAEKTIEMKQQETLETSMRKLANGIRDIVKENGLLLEELCGIVIGVDGIVNYVNGMIYYPIHNQQWGKNAPIKKILGPLLGYEKIFVDNGSRFCMYELLSLYPSYKNKKIVSILTGESIGGCIFANGEIDHGANGLIGEIGHLIVDPGYTRRKCTCGSYGCFETMVSSEALVEYAILHKNDFPESKLIERLDRGCSYQDIFTLSNEGDPLACCVVDEAVEKFMHVFRTLILICDPDIVIVGGEYAKAGRYFENRIYENACTIPFFGINAPTQIKFEKHITGRRHVCIGAAWYLMDQYLRNDDIYA